MTFNIFGHWWPKILDCNGFICFFFPPVTTKRGSMMICHNHWLQAFWNPQSFNWCSFWTVKVYVQNTMKDDCSIHLPKVDSALLSIDAFLCFVFAGNEITHFLNDEFDWQPSSFVTLKIRSTATIYTVRNSNINPLLRPHAARWKGAGW